MNKKMIITLAITQLILIGSLLVIASDNDQINTSDDKITETCLGACGSCEDSCDCFGYCNSQGNENCDGTGTCNQYQQRSNSCNSICDGSGTCGQKTRQTRNCYSTSSCSGTCNN